jgi:hypothetical protein
MTKQQTLTIVVADDMADPAELVEGALERYLGFGPIRPEYDLGEEGGLLEEFAERSPAAYMIIEEA